MGITVYDEGKISPSSSFVFPGGEVQVSITAPKRCSYSPASPVEIHAIVKDSDDLMILLLKTDALRRAMIKEDNQRDILLVLPYVPYARQDRVMNDGESLSIKVFCDLINSQNYKQVIIHDPHSDVTPALLNNCVIMSQASILQSQLPFGEQYHKPTLVYKEKLNAELAFKESTVLVAPDAGALKKIRDVAKTIGIEQVVCAEKVRDTKTGAITGTVVHSEHMGNKDFLIVDDICDGGKTFTELAKALRPLTDGKIILYVTHGIFSKGLDVFKGLIDEVYCGNSFERFPPNVELLSYVPF